MSEQFPAPYQESDPGLNVEIAELQYDIRGLVDGFVDAQPLWDSQTESYTSNDPGKSDFESIAGLK